MGTSTDLLSQSTDVSNLGGRSPSSFAIWSAMTSVYIIWGSTFLAIRIAIETIPPFLMAAIRFPIAGGTLYLIRHPRGDGISSFSEWRSEPLTLRIIIVASIVIGSVALTTVSQQASTRSK